MCPSSLDDIVAERPFPEYADWWPMGKTFSKFMSQAIHANWKILHNNREDIRKVTTYAEDYINTVYKRAAKPNLVTDFVELNSSSIIYSGEFDALSYAFHRSAFEEQSHEIQDKNTLSIERREFTKRVGKYFFRNMAEHLDLDLPSHLISEDDLLRLEATIEKIGGFLKDEGYLRKHFAFRFDVNLKHRGTKITQNKSDILGMLQEGEIVYALYEMGYPVIMPSAVCLYHTIGEAQHHSSRIIGELFERVNCRASETADFDPRGYPSEMVVELWEIQRIS